LIYQEDAIRKILGLDSDKKKEEKRLKEKEQKVQKRAPLLLPLFFSSVSAALLSNRLNVLH
jgi:hypothetical protein